MSGPPLLIHGHVGPASGEIHHPGDVKIDGNLLSGGLIRADGDLHITGHVTSATAMTSGSLTVGGIVSGPTSVLDAIGRISVLHALDATIVAGTDIAVGAAAERCVLCAGRDIRVGGRPGLIRGGTVRAGRSVATVRLEAGGRGPAMIEIGGRVFADDPDELEERLALARKQTIPAKGGSVVSPEAYRRGLAGLRACRRLAQSLGYRLRQGRAAAGRTDHPWLSVTGAVPVSAAVLLGPDGQATELPRRGPFEIGLTDELVAEGGRL